MIANQYEQIGEDIIATCVQPFHQFNGEFANKRKDLRAEYARNMKQLDECGKEMDKSKENWSSKFKNAEKAKQQYDKVGRHVYCLFGCFTCLGGSRRSRDESRC